MPLLALQRYSVLKIEGLRENRFTIILSTRAAPVGGLKLCSRRRAYVPAETYVYLQYGHMTQLELVGGVSESST